MIKKFIFLPIKSVFNLLFLVLFCIAVPVKAATVHSIKSNNEPIQLENNQANTFTDLSLDLMSPDTGDLTHLSSPDSNTVVFVTFDNSNASDVSDLKSFHKKLMTEYGDSILVQESLNSLYEVRQLWDELDASATDFSYDVLFALKLDQFIENDLYNMQKPQHYQYDKVNGDIYDKVKRVQKAKKNAATNNYQESTDDFISHLLRKQTLYYLFALFILFSLLQRLIRFLLRLFP